MNRSLAETAPGSDPDFDRAITGRLRNLGRLVRLVTVGTGLSVVVSAAAAAALVTLGVDYGLHLEWEMRAALLAVSLGGLAALWYRWLLKPLAAPLRTDKLAGMVERRYPELGDTLVSAVQLSVRPRPDLCSPALVAKLMAEVSAKTSALRFSAVAESGPMRRRLPAAVLLAALLAAVGALTPPGTMGIWFRRNVLLARTNWPRMTHLIVEGVQNGRMVHPRGDDLRISAHLKEGTNRPRRVVLQRRGAGGRAAPATMVSVGRDRYRCDLPQVTEDFRFRLVGGDAETPWIAVKLVDRPQAEDVTLTVTPPAYTGETATQLRTGQTAATLLGGSEVEVGFTTNVEVVSAWLVEDEVEIAEGRRVGPRQWRCRLAPTVDTSAGFHLVDAGGLENRGGPRLTLRVVKDKAPVVRLSVDGVSDLVTPQAVLPISVRAQDQYGIATAGLDYRIAATGEDSREGTIPLKEPGTTVKNLDTQTEIAPAAWGLAAGQELSLQAVATDLDDVNGPNEGRSFVTRVRVVAPEELAAELQRREQEHRREFERLLDSQENLRSRVLEELGGGQAPGRGAGQPGQRRLPEAARQQRLLTLRVKGVRAQFAQIMREMEVNRMADATVRRRLAVGIVEPLDRLARTQMPEVESLLLSAGPADRLDAGMSGVIVEMRSVLGHMLQWAGYQEALLLLGKLIEQQEELNRRTEAELEKEVRELFGGE